MKRMFKTALLLAALVVPNVVTAGVLSNFWKGTKSCARAAAGIAVMPFKAARNAGNAYLDFWAEKPIGGLIVHMLAFYVYAELCEFKRQIDRERLEDQRAAQQKAAAQEIESKRYEAALAQQAQHNHIG